MVAERRERRRGGAERWAPTAPAECIPRRTMHDAQANGRQTIACNFRASYIRRVVLIPRVGKTRERGYCVGQARHESVHMTVHPVQTTWPAAGAAGVASLPAGRHATAALASSSAGGRSTPAADRPRIRSRTHFAGRVPHARPDAYVTLLPHARKKGRIDDCRTRSSAHATIPAPRTTQDNPDFRRTAAGAPTRAHALLWDRRTRQPSTLATATAPRTAADLQLHQRDPSDETMAIPRRRPSGGRRSRRSGRATPATGAVAMATGLHAHFAHGSRATRV